MVTFTPVFVEFQYPATTVPPVVATVPAVNAPGGVVSLFTGTVAVPVLPAASSPCAVIVTDASPKVHPSRVLSALPFMNAVNVPEAIIAFRLVSKFATVNVSVAQTNSFVVGELMVTEGGVRS